MTRRNIVAHFPSGRQATAMYLWLKALHVIAVISWMAGMLYLPRLFVYHCDAEPGSPKSETFKVMERRLLKAIMLPAMIVTWLAGLWLAYSGGCSGMAGARQIADGVGAFGTPRRVFPLCEGLCRRSETAIRTNSFV